MWERFSFYLMLGLLPLFMFADPSVGGLGFSEEKIGLTIGTYMGLVYFTPFIGGLLADKVIGYRNAVVIGAIVMCAGHISLAFKGMSFFYLGLALLIIGNGFFKPNISTMLGRLYPKTSNLRDAGFNIFYLGINLGALICNFVAAIVRNKYGWHAAFGTAGVGLAIGLVIFLTVYKRLARAEISSEEKRGAVGTDEGLKTLWSKVLPASIVMATIGYWVKDVTWAFFAACVPVVIYYYRLWATASREEKGPIGALLTISLVLVPFWMVFNLNSTVLSFWAEKNTDREVSANAVPTLKYVNLLENAPAGYFDNAKPEIPRPDKSWLKVIGFTTTDKEVMAKEEAAIKGAYAKTLELKGYEVAGPVPVTAKELETVYKHSGGNTLNPGEALPVANAELFQSVNPAWVIMLTPLLVGIWSILRRKKAKPGTPDESRPGMFAAFDRWLREKEPSTPGKIGLGMLFASGCWLVMLAAVAYSNDGGVKVSPFWLIGAYGVITIGELCLSPVGLSLVTKLAPARLGAVMMGGFFISISVGNKLSGVAGGPVWKSVPHNYFFIGLTILMVVFAIVIFRLRRWLNQYIPKEENQAH